MGSAPQKRSLWQTYTPRNIRNEIQLRLSALRGAQQPPVHAAADAEYEGTHASAVGEFYDTHHSSFMKVYGGVIQAFRTKDITDLLDHQIRVIGFKPGQRVLDAGCGVAVPAIYFSCHADVSVDAITISGEQFQLARQKVAASCLSGNVNVVLGDYHRLTDHFPKDSFDVVYFLESFGHSRSKRHLIQACWDVLKPGGTLFIKDLFRRIPLRSEHEQRIEREIRKINEAYRYEVGDLNSVLDILRGRGFILASLQNITLDLEQFEDLAISNEFQELTGLALITNWEEYVFPVDFFEITCVKPEFSLDERLDRHFLQTRYHRRYDQAGQ